MARSALAVVAGIVCAGLSVGLIESIGHWLYPPPPGLDISDPDQLRSIMDRLPTGALVIVIIGWAVGALVGGLVAARIAREQPLRCASIVGAAMIVLVAINIVFIPHPTWMTLLALVLPLPMARLGSRLAGGDLPVAD